MEFLKRLFGGKAQEGGLEPAAVREKDNIGTRVETESQLDAHWWKRQTSQQFDPFVQYVFDRELDARNALLGLDCIHAAADSGRLISTEVLVFGYPRCDDGKWYALVCGRDLSYDLWLAAKVSFEKHGGTLIRDLEPQTSKEAKTTPTSAAAPAKPEFVREERKRNMEVTMVYRIYRAPDAASAKAFLSGQPETTAVPLHCCRDTGGKLRAGHSGHIPGVSNPADPGGIGDVPAVVVSAGPEAPACHSSAISGRAEGDCPY